ncbi:MAG: heme lyase CcmF/NrfE family subunit [Acidobacteriota bacterium]
MIELGRYCLLFSVLLCGYGVFAGAWGGARKNLALIRSAENAAIGNFVIALSAAVCLWYLLLTDQFQLEYVASYSSANQPPIYKLTALWGGQSGSLLFWELILALFTAVAVLQNRRRHRALMPYATAVLLGIAFFFSLLLNFATSPFDLLTRVPPDGQGLNPLLQNAYMAIHPPMLYLGFVSLSLPFAFAMGALISGRLDTSWIRTTRRWALVSWCFLTFGITLGGMWAYEELGWGGYWAWDPVENASFMPWLVATAFLHSIMITEKKGMLKVWNFVLVLLAFELSIFGTFITRSGVISSVHSFALSNLGPFFVVFLVFTSLLGIAWIVYRADQLRSELRMRSFLSREATFLLNNWLFVSICFAVFWGTVFPILSEAVTGEKITVSAPFFNQVTLPLWLSLLILTGICPLIAWRKASAKNFRRNFLYPIGGGMLTGVVLLALGIHEWVPLLFFSSAGFVTMTIYFEFYKGARARQSIGSSGFLVALRDLTLMNKRRYGGFIIHAGAVLAFVGIVASSFFSLEKSFTVKQGESFTLGGYTLVSRGLTERRDPEKNVVSAPLDVYSDGNLLARIVPEKHFHHKSEQPQTEVSIRSTLKEDLYVVLSGWDENGITFHLFINPLVMMIWIGVLIMVLGGVFVLFGDRKRVAAMLLRKSKAEVRENVAA